MEYVEAVLTSIGLLKDVWFSISRCFNYRKILDKNCTILKEKMEILKCREQDFYTKLHDAQYQRKKGKKEVEHWLKKVQDMRSEVERMEGEVREVRKGRWLSRLELLRQSEENIEKVDKLLEEGRFPEGILIEVVRDEGKALLVPQLTGETTAKRNVEKIWKCLKEGGTQSIGVWGLGGIGKTTIVIHIHNLLLEEKDAFGAVFWVTVSKDSSIPKLQDSIASKMNLDLSKEEDERKRSALLFEALQKEKKFVLIFDDLWEVYPPEVVGIPIGVAADGGGGKLIVTTRSKEVCQKMGCKEIIRVEPLHEEEAWELFNTTLDRHNPLSQEEEKIAKAIAKECAGLPLAIVTTARSMSIVYDIAEWRNALNELRGHNIVKGCTIDMDNDVFKILEFSYNRLNDDRLRECFLYCALFPEDHVIRRACLIGYWINEGLVEEMESRQTEFDRGHAILNKLENLCLLERCENGKCVKMHDMVRDMTINITGKNPRFMVKASVKLEDLPSGTEWPNTLERVSLMGNRISSYMSVPNCPKLSTLLLQRLPQHFLLGSYEIGLPDSFFMHMAGSLRVLDLSRTEITCLPDSIYDLVNLRALILSGCWRLKEVRSLAKLKELRKLNLDRNKLPMLPDGIEKLVHLKEFKWSRWNQLVPLARYSVFRLVLPDLVPNLQCLTLDDATLFDVGGEGLGELRKLEILDVRFSSINNFDSYVRKNHYQRLTHYHLILNVKGHYFRRSQGLSKEVAVQGYKLIGAGKEKENDEDDQLLLPANLQILRMIHCEILPSSSSSSTGGAGLLDVSPSLKTATDLKACELIQCLGIEYVWWADDDCIALFIHTLCLEYLPNLKVLFKLRSKETVSCFSSLKHLYVEQCHNLKNLFTPRLVKYHLQNLQSIFVLFCTQMEDIIAAEAAEEEETEMINSDHLSLHFPNLQTFKLVGLPKLKSIWRHGRMSCDSLRRLTVWNCPNLQSLPLSAPPLKEVRGEKEWWDAVESEAKSLFRPLFKPVEEGQRSIRELWAAVEPQCAKGEQISHLGIFNKIGYNEFNEFTEDYMMHIEQIYEEVD